MLPSLDSRSFEIPDESIGQAFLETKPFARCRKRRGTR
jgi:hypothetical protein